MICFIKVDSFAPQDRATPFPRLFVVLVFSVFYNLVPYLPRPIPHHAHKYYD